MNTKFTTMFAGALGSAILLFAGGGLATGYIGPADGGISLFSFQMSENSMNEVIGGNDCNRSDQFETGNCEDVNPPSGPACEYTELEWETWICNQGQVRDVKTIAHLFCSYDNCVNVPGERKIGTCNPQVAPACPVGN